MGEQASRFIRFLPLDNTNGPGGYVFDKQDETLVFWSQSMIFAVIAADALDHATDEEISQIKADGKLRFEAYEAGCRSHRLIYGIRKRAGLLEDGEEEPRGDVGDGGEPVHDPVEYDAAARAAALAREKADD